MEWYDYVADAVATLFLVNSIPHLVSGLTGTPFPSPFSSPPGRANSPAVINVVWGSANLVIVGLLFTGAEWSVFTPNPGVEPVMALRFLIGIYPAIVIAFGLVALQEISPGRTIYDGLVLGTVLILVILVMPAGITGTILRLARRGRAPPRSDTWQRSRDWG